MPLVLAGCLVGVDPEDFAAGGEKAPHVGTAVIVLAPEGRAPAAGAPATAETPLICAVNPLSDPDGDPLEIQVLWKVNAQEVQATVTDDPFQLSNPSHQLSGGFARGALVQCEVRVTDGTFSRSSESVSVVIGNAPPSIVVFPDAPAVDSSAPTICDALTSDPDGDPVEVSWTWSYASDGATLPSDDQDLTSVLAAGAAERAFENAAVEVRCEATARDPDGASRTSSTTAVVRNMPPQVLGLTLDPSLASRDDTLHASASASDAEGNPITLAWAWRVNGLDIGVTTDQLDLSTVPLEENGSLIQAFVTASDAFGSSAPVGSPPAVIVNAAPVIDSVTLSPPAVQGFQDLSVTTEVVDPEGEPLTLEHLWTVNGIAQGATGDTLSAGHFEKGNVVAVQVVARDPRGALAVGFAQVVVSDSPPTDPVVEAPSTYAWTQSAAMPSYAVADPSLHITGIPCQITTPAVDNDGDPITYLFRLIRESDGAVVFEGSTIDAEGYGLPVSTLDTYRCEVTATSDGTSSASTLSEPVTPIELVELPWYRLGTRSSCTKLALGHDLVDGIVCWDGHPDLLAGETIDHPVFVADPDRSIVDGTPDLVHGCITEAPTTSADSTVAADVRCSHLPDAPTQPASYTARWEGGQWTGHRPRVASSPDGACVQQTNDDFQCFGDQLDDRSWCSLRWSGGRSFAPCPGDHTFRLLDQDGPLVGYADGFCASEDRLPVINDAIGITTFIDSAACYGWEHTEPHVEVSMPVRVDQLSVGWTGQTGCGVRDGSVDCWGLGGATGAPFDTRRTYTSVAVVRPGQVGTAFVAAVEAGGQVWVAPIDGSTEATLAEMPAMLWLEAGRTAACGVSVHATWECVAEGGSPGLDARPPLDRARFVRSTETWGVFGEPQHCRVTEPDGNLVCDVWSLGAGDLPPPNVGGVTAIDVAPRTGCVVDGDGELACWGAAEVAAAVPAGVFVDVSTAGYFAVVGACARRSNGSVLCWRDGLQVEHPGPFSGLTTSANRLCASDTQGRLTCFDEPIELLEASTPFVPPDTLFGVTESAADGAWGCALSQGLVTCWNLYQPGQVFRPTGTYTAIGTSPQTQVSPTVFAPQVCALSLDGRLRCWNPVTETAGTTDVDRASRIALAAVDLSGQACGVDVFDREVCWGGPVLRRTLQVGAPLEDLDGDGFPSTHVGGFDCDDTDPLIFPGGQPCTGP